VRTTLVLLLLAALAAADRVVLKDRTVLEGTVVAGDGTLAVGGKTVPLADVLLWEDGGDVPRHFGSLESHMKAYRVLTDRLVLAACEEAFPRAVGAEDGRAILERAERAGLDAKEADQWTRKIGHLKEDAPAGAVVVDARRIALDFYVDRARKAIAGGVEKRGLELLRVVLRVDPKHEGALALLNEQVPDGWRVGDARTWLDWQLDVFGSVAGRVHVLRKKNYDLEIARQHWRNDLHGVESSEIVFITPMKRSDVVAHCVGISALTCRALEEVFHTDTPAREETDPLVIYFYEDREEYVKFSQGQKRAGPGPMIAFSAGHYSSVDNISRFFWPAGPDPQRSVHETFVHELTHHWIERRCPLWHAREIASMLDQVQTPGFWIVEGFAVFMQEGIFDAETGGWSLFDPHAMMLDIVASVGEKKQLLDWDRLYGLTQIEWNRTLNPTKAVTNYEGRWVLHPMPMSEMLLAYKQSGATCNFLYWGEDGKYRKRLLEYVKAYYTGRKTGTGIETVFGITPAELGAKVEAHARAVAAGWRPKTK